jgi:predicted outer membrane repeat protein
MCGLLTASALEAATYVVNSPLDALGDNPGNGVCETAPGNGVCTLRRAIYEANRVAGGGATIDLSTLAGGLVTLTIPASGGDNEDTGDLNITAAVTIIGTGPTNTIIDGNGLVTLSRVFSISGGPVTMSGVTIRHGAATTTGGGIDVTGGAGLTLNNVLVTDNTAAGDGGGVASTASLTVRTSVIQANVSGASGGGISRRGTSGLGARLTIQYSTIRTNSAVDGGGIANNSDAMDIVGSTFNGNTASGSGGALHLAGETTPALQTTIVSSTMSGNTANVSGGGINAVLPAGGDVVIFSSTIAGNQADLDFDSNGTGGGIFAGAGVPVSFENTILAGNIESVLVMGDPQQAPGECEGTLTSGGFNLMAVVDCAVTGPAPVVGDPLLGPLQANGGLNATRALLVGSPAINGGDPLGCDNGAGGTLAVDQRRYRLAAGNRCDIGAFEGAATAPVRAPSHDVSGDGQADLVWRHRVDGNNALWMMDGGVIESSQLLTQVPDGNWQIVGVDDFDGDGDADLLWRDSASRQMAIWLMNGFAIESAGFLPTVDDSTCRVAATGDFDHTSQADIVWQCGAQNKIWFLDGVALQASQSLPAVGGPWTLVASGDFHGDGFSDVLWRNPATGQNAIWRLEGTTIIFADYLPTVNEAGWFIVNTLDGNGDGASDIVWRNAITGRNAIWLMGGFGIVGAGYLPTVEDLDWEMKAFGDYDGNGRTDIVWRHRLTGQNVLWFMDGTSVSSMTALTTVDDTAWEIR